jgi:hypothetical protein
VHDIGPTRLESESYEGIDRWATGEVTAEWGEVPLAEIQEMELAAALLEVATEEELERFIGNLFGTVGTTMGRFVGSDTGRALGGILKGAARQALPLVGRAAGRWVSPARGGQIGADMGRVAGQLFGLELEGLSPEDTEFEVARQFVRFATTAVQTASKSPRTARALQAAHGAAMQAAREHAPGLLPRLRGRSGLLWPRSGRWERQGRMIILYGT